MTLSSGGEEGFGSGPTFIFTGLNKLKPKMIADATARAREAADQFAHDSHSSLGSIRTANQGVFEILPSRNPVQGMNESGQTDKTVRVVSTVEYFLKNWTMRRSAAVPLTVIPAVLAGCSSPAPPMHCIDPVITAGRHRRLLRTAFRDSPRVCLVLRWLALQRRVLSAAGRTSPTRHFAT